MPSNLNTDGIPAELRDVPHWIVWRLTRRDGKPDKPPFDHRTDRPGSVKDPACWMDFGTSVATASRYDGIGFAFDPSDPYAGIDLDRCLTPEGDIEPWAERIVDGLQSYTERSPSGRGLHVIVRGRLPMDARHKRTGFGPGGEGAVEFYDRARYFTVTGDRWPGTPATIEDRAEELIAFHRELFPPDPAANGNGRHEPRPHDLSDEAILERARRAWNGPRFAALFDAGDTSRHHGDESRADLALCANLAFWCGGAADVMDRLFRRSALYRDKWDELRGAQTYGARTIARALEGMRSFYDPIRPRAANGDGGGNGNGNDHPMPGGLPDPGGDVGGLGADDDPHRLARLFLGRDEPPRLRYWNEEWHRWDGHAWRVCPDREIAAEITRAIKAEFDRAAIATFKHPKPVTVKAVANVVQALRDLALLRLHDCPRQPAWLGPFEPGEDLPEPREVLPAGNALVHLPAFVEGSPCLLPLTPRFFSPNCLSYPFVQDSPPPREWLGFLDSLWPDDPESIAALQEWFGYLLTSDTSQQKILMLIGPKRSGKGTIGRVLRALVGHENVAAPTLSGLATPFGSQPLIGKTVAMISDARLSGRADSAVIVERLLSISGEDAQTIDRKHRSSWTGTLPTRFVLISNELPRLGDASGALPSRMVLLGLTRSFYGREDTGLTSRLMAERSAILRWAVDGWGRLFGRGHFLQPESGGQLMADLDELSSPVGLFIAERCDLGPDHTVQVKELFAAWKEFCKEKGRDHPGDEQGFGRNLRAVLPRLTVRRLGADGSRVRVYEGIDLKAVF